MHVYSGLFLIALATLALEVTLTRLLSVITYYHLAFFAIATAMLGITAGATTVYLKPDWFSREKLDISIAKACWGYALVTPFALIILCTIPFVLVYSIMGIFVLMMATVTCSLPFYFSGVAITSALTQYRLPIGKIYASDLIGASTGCLLVLACFEVMDAPSLVLLCSALGMLAGFSFGRHNSNFKLRHFFGGSLAILILTLLIIINSCTNYGISPLFVKGRFETPGTYLFKKWNSFSRVGVSKGFWERPQYWGPSPLAPQEPRPQFFMNIDGDAGTTLCRFASLEDIEHLRFDVTNIAYFLRPHGGACIIGVGGGRDIQSAILFGHKKVIGVDVNP
ncbi:hypothetical protein ACFL0O_08410, partial [Thermodesulfobacteriota bacterium]